MPPLSVTIFKPMPGALRSRAQLAARGRACSLLAGKEASAVASAHKADAAAAPDSRDECGCGGGQDGRLGGHQHPASHQKLQPDVHCYG